MKVRIAMVGAGMIAEKRCVPRILGNPRAECTMVDCIAGDRQVIPSGEHARHVLEIMRKAMVAARTGETQALDTTFQAVDI
jgi:predicted dehydrogenase